jgi:Kef-type K+ transport system membrane component KefB
MSSTQLAQVLVAISLLVAAAHIVGQVFARFRQPAVIGEIVGGLLLGPSLLGVISPGAVHALFPSTGPTATVLSALSQLGLVLLMFCSGMELRAAFHRADRRLVTAIAVTGMILPFSIGLLLVRVAGVEHLSGPAHDNAAVVVVFSLAIAVTSIPVISRIMFDLGILHTSFARVVLSVAVTEDVVVYVILALTLGAAATSGAPLTDALGIEPGSLAQATAHVGATLVVLVALLVVMPLILQRLAQTRRNADRVVPALTRDLVLLLLVCAACIAVGVAPMLGAFATGIAAARSSGTEAAEARGALRDFSFAFFIPLYFATVGLQLDLVHHFDPIFFVWFAVAASLAKTVSVVLGGLVGGAGRRDSANLAVAMNARGGPGIVLATVAFQAHVINEEFYAALVMLAIVTSLAAGSWLGRLVRTGRLGELRTEPTTHVSTGPVRESEWVVGAGEMLREDA